jgi:glycosyltransferase involved in cell wall biosynthesis
LRILIVEPDLSDNGAIRVTLDRGSRWVGESEVDVLITSPDRRNNAGVVDPQKNLRMHFGISRPRRRIVMLVIVAGRDIGNGLLVAGALSLICRRPLAITVQSAVGPAIKAYVPPRFQNLTRAIYRRADLAVCVSAGLVDSLLEIGVPRKNIAVVLNGLDCEGVLALARQTPSIPLPAGRFIVGVGRLQAQKGFDLLIRAHAAALAGGAPPHTLLIIGDGGDRNALVALAAELGVADSVELPGFVDNPHAINARADVFMMSSRWEGFSLVIAEALTAGIPIIAANCVSGPSEILEEGRFGDLVPVDDVPSLTAALTRHLMAPEILRSKALAGSATMAERFSPTLAADRHRQLLEKLVAS